METNKYIYINENSISRELCEDIINLFEVEEKKYDGVTQEGVRKDIKDTTDYIINSQDKKWTKIHYFLKTELNNNLKSYFKKLNKNDCINNTEQLSSKVEYNYFSGLTLFFNIFMIQKYNKNKGRYIYHNDFIVDFSNKSYRVIDRI